MFKPIKPLTFIKYRTKTRYVADIIRSYDFYQKDAEYRRNQCENYYKVDMDLDILNEIFHFNDPMYKNIGLTLDGFNEETCVLEKVEDNLQEVQNVQEEEIYFNVDDPIFKLYKLLNEMQNKTNEIISVLRLKNVLPLPEMNLECVANALNGKSQINLLDRMNELEMKIKLSGRKYKNVEDEILDEHTFIFNNAISKIKGDKSIIFNTTDDNQSLLSNDEIELKELGRLSKNIEGGVNTNKLGDELRNKLLPLVTNNIKTEKKYKLSTIWKYHVGKNISESCCNICNRIITVDSCSYVVPETINKITIDAMYLICKKCKKNIGEESLLNYCTKNYPKCNLFTGSKMRNSSFIVPALSSKHANISESLDKLLVNSI